ncbi:unnamed protein product [Ilex paraguariensis]|uniref:ABC transporter domain-containing protein n=1 Tax=Ilex paraguariensis TaxID=185542 RepID=A0ABC8TU95_9AQUA
MCGTRINTSWVPYLSLLLILCLGFSPCVWCVDGDDYSQSSNPTVLPLVTSLIYSQISNLTKIFGKDITKSLGFCIKDVDADMNLAFNFSNNLDFLNNCVRQTKDVTKRICTAAEIKFYFDSFFYRKASEAQILKPNRNCNLTSWVPGCEPGWACSVGPNEKVDLKNSTNMPDRTLDSQPCCEGFFCPRGLTCMIGTTINSLLVSQIILVAELIFGPMQLVVASYSVQRDHTVQLLLPKNHAVVDITAGRGQQLKKTVTTAKSYYKLLGVFGIENRFKTQNSHIQVATMATEEHWTTREIGGLPGCSLQIGVLSIMLIIFYNCSDQVLTTRYERLAKSRESAARSARETAQARERWKLAKDVAKKRAMGLQQQLSRTFSRKTSVRQPEELKVLNQPRPGKDDASLPPQVPSNSSTPLQSSSAPKGQKKEPSNLTKMLHSIDDNPESNEGFNLEIGNKHTKKQMPKGKQLHTRSQIFKYAYGQLEKEKAMEQKNQNLTFSGVISMATDTEIRTRPRIEVAFKDLTLTLKGKNKHLMRCITGKIMPGRISAVMGPSGAGKTTFLSAVTGKITGCTMSGSILINGKSGSIDSYKKIIGFVPQDDIVHGNLTVEENLRFSARCRLAADMPKPDKVLVVERVIESLGLRTVRESLVGTVEKRGISGGQRKRVNVGLEMVMEPSLLILDEPTSGLDSSSSNLLLRALRREALEGVNICMVVHQPR